MPSIPQTPTELDLGVATRQALGTPYERPKDQSEQLARIKSGTIRLEPHGDWDGDYTDWHADPFTDSNWQFQFHSLRWASPLRWAAQAGDEDARAEWLRITRSWFDVNVPSKPGLARFAWMDMTDGNRAIHLSLGAPLARPEDHWFVELLEYHRDWLMDPAHIKRKNHGLHQNMGLLVVAAALRDREGMDTAVARMEKQFQTTFDDQGCNDEGSVAYHQHNISWWQSAWRRAELEGYNTENVNERLEAAAHALAHLAMPNGQLPQIGDSARGMAKLGMHDYTDYAHTRGASGKKPHGNALILDGGYVASRSGWGENRPVAKESHMVLRHGVDVKSHSHQDRGSIHIYAAGSLWLTDSGFYSYQRGDLTRKHLASREAHNVALLRGRKHNDGAPVDLVAQSVTDKAHDFTVADRGYKDDVLTRRVIYLPGPDCWIVVDSSQSPDPVVLAQHWHLEPGVGSQFRDRGFRLSRNGQTLDISWLGRTPALRRNPAVDGKLTGWVSTRWKTLVPGAQLVASTTASATNKLVTLISPRARQPLGVVDSLVRKDGSVSVALVRGGKIWNILADDTGTSVNET